jgi:hypothetical protein
VRGVLFFGLVLKQLEKRGDFSEIPGKFLVQGFQDVWEKFLTI